MITIDTLIQWERKYSEDVVEDGPYVYTESDEKILIPIIKEKLSNENITISDFDDMYDLHEATSNLADDAMGDVLRITMEAFADMLNFNKVDPNLFN